MEHKTKTELHEIPDQLSSLGYDCDELEAIIKALAERLAPALRGSVETNIDTSPSVPKDQDMSMCEVAMSVRNQRSRIRQGIADIAMIIEELQL